MTAALKVIIADDEPLAISNLKAKLAVYPNMEIVDCFDNGDDTLQFLQTATDIDLVFLDIQMPGIKGIEILQQAAKGSAMTRPLYILVTAYEQFAFSAFEHFAFDYLLKPVSRQRLAQTLLDARTALDKPSEQAMAVAANKLTFKTGASTLLLDDIEILQIEAAGNYMCIHTLNDTLVIRETMKELLQRLPQQFVQVHRSVLLNLHHAHKVQPHNNDYEFTLSNGKKVVASRRYKMNWADQLSSLPQH
ncbi:MAG: LytTR family DNA-binding domain-containing protein [Gammaproteobacteria bacterium]|nr:LytTR family DNA-binding domain-containing protein [Gammaproteobacteria bacterium]MBU1556701.1 LytTR family DNA-binding domain-containing protein [Gammaproteobacteria bacterium]MBU2071182.1 LytTR family DNA-binding domain-containing protein [Gammaproteobacteria bacterium]MBU2184368.1 LytTR family DNA-binding domain-containing protein [Gammaproteobacteria bacterium]MBU2206250.1 LytTR family DNA-binding domain-containing protein [Gammaproteobacteria bacterium]